MARKYQDAVQQAWQQRQGLSQWLAPIAWLYGVVSGMHRCLYRARLRRVDRLPVPVLVVGNVVAGGAGKTPTVLGLVNHLIRTGHRPGVLSRGYKGAHAGPTPVLEHSRACDVGDEPVALRRASGVPVVVGRDRLAAGTLLLQRFPEVTHIICDDGMQHYRLFRDIEICVFDARGIGNGRLLPAGPLRQPWPRHPVAVSGQSASRTLVLRTGDCAMSGYRATRSLAPRAVNAHGQSLDLHALGADGRPLHAVAGIAQPDNFFQMLRHAGLVLDQTEAYPDHHDFSHYRGTDPSRALLICTEKDAVKLWEVRPDAWAVALVQTLPDDFLQAFDALLATTNVHHARPHHGHTTH